MTSNPAEMTVTDLRAHVAAELRRTRERSLALTDVDDADLIRQHSPLMSPLVWDLAHVGSQEEMWLVRDVGGATPIRPDIDGLYDAFQHRRSDRPRLPLLGPTEARSYLNTVRDKVFELLDHTSLQGRPLVEQAFGFGMIIAHEQQHDETMLATHQLRSGPPALTAKEPPPATEVGDMPAEVRVPAGSFVMGTSSEAWALDNERPAHEVNVEEFLIDTTPVTNEDFIEFIADGGYHRRGLWSDTGWFYRQHAGVCTPRFWVADGDRWLRHRFGRLEPVPIDEPVVHVSFYEADAYARWAGKRLPSECEWEKAARFDPHSGRSLRYPWGDSDPEPKHANLGQRYLQPAPAGAFPRGAAPCGARQMLGDVWEWTSSDFQPYPGFVAFPYREYSEAFFGREYKVLRGGSFGTDALACRGTFRNWDYPIRRQIFSGLRCARTPGTGELS